MKWPCMFLKEDKEVTWKVWRHEIKVKSCVIVTILAVVNSSIMYISEKVENMSRRKNDILVNSYFWQNSLKIMSIHKLYALCYFQVNVKNSPWTVSRFMYFCDLTAFHQ